MERRHRDVNRIPEIKQLLTCRSIKQSKKTLILIFFQQEQKIHIKWTIFNLISNNAINIPKSILSLGSCNYTPTRKTIVKWYLQHWKQSQINWNFRKFCLFWNLLQFRFSLECLFKLHTLKGENKYKWV